ncbi:hypothetical protein QNH46_02675 [Paenibacillus woosongensis]|uniref:Thioredoxin domain-containing protein n=1 Tax=Paenibacillus woosongensis TaxID=307580 RepID=A0AA95IBI8_9BACL|nr:hypothetical protein [Paenibacillus woosongensis]WHX49610.1 hypothetical protein QNH46_02675 [Paenibacillus woosongensis]
MKSLSEILQLARDQKKEENSSKLTTIQAFDIDYISGRKSIYLVISLSCMHCIELIPHLNELNSKDTFYLITDGNDNDNQEIRKEFKYEFEVYSYTKPYDRINIYKTPTALLVDENGNIIDSHFTPFITDVINFCNKVV